ncbi:MAG: hypothetical protein DME98_11280 [Verrucomicrobia bacterium]|nr:MAG: hypothetical protein DME98_11280 [Verrucomicrobiota bacterium]PYJ32038.1 MAG: hypothetical protein DME88_12500 [Verrucomicrobiota bacterium]
MHSGVFCKRLTASCWRAHVSGDADDLPVSPGKRFDHLVRVSSLANPAISPIPLPSLRFLNV